jgi:hypothetical protein
MMQMQALVEAKTHASRVAGKRLPKELVDNIMRYATVREELLSDPRVMRTNRDLRTRLRKGYCCIYDAVGWDGMVLQILKISNRHEVGL